jgi:hypothetical protein
MRKDVQEAFGRLEAQIATHAAGLHALAELMPRDDDRVDMASLFETLAVSADGLLDSLEHWRGQLGK